MLYLCVWTVVRGVGLCDGMLEEDGEWDMDRAGTDSASVSWVLSSTIGKGVSRLANAVPFHSIGALAGERFRRIVVNTCCVEATNVQEGIH